MPTDSSLVFNLSLTTGILAISLAVLLLTFWPILHWLHDSWKGNERKKTLIHRQNIEILEAARVRAREIISDASSRSAEIIGSAEMFEKESKELLLKMYKEASQKRKEELERVGNEVVSKFRSELESVGKQNVERFSQIVKKIETGVDSEIKEFAATLKSEVSESQKSIAEKTQEAYLKMLSEVELVRREKEKRLEDSVYKVLFKVSESVIGKALSFEDHQDLVRRVLHDAEQQELTKS